MILFGGNIFLCLPVKIFKIHFGIIRHYEFKQFTEVSCHSPDFCSKRIFLCETFLSLNYSLLLSAYSGTLLSRTQ